jgi:hypothetical protein
MRDPIRSVLCSHALLNTFFDRFMATTIHFDSEYDQSPAADKYCKASRQLRPCIQDGCVGLTSAALVAPAASYVALRELSQLVQCKCHSVRGLMLCTLSPCLQVAHCLLSQLPTRFPHLSSL